MAGLNWRPHSTLKGVLAFLLLAIGQSPGSWGQDGPPAVVPANSGFDQLQPRRGFAPLPINDLRSPSAPSSSPASDPQLNAPPAGLPAASPAPGQTGNTSGVFLRQGPAAAAPAPDPNAVGGAGEPQVSTFSSPPAFGTEGNALLPPRGQSTPNSRPVELISNQPIQDNQIRLASGSEPEFGLPNRLPRHSGSASPELVRQLLARYDLNKASEPLPGQPLRLADALQSTPPERRRAIVKQYWQTYGAWASYLNRCDRCGQLAVVNSSSDPQQLQLLETSRLVAEDERLQAELRLQWAQLELNRLLPSSGSDVLPLPADQPLVQAYETHQDWYVANGALPPALQQVARSLPKQLELILHRAATAEHAAAGVSRRNQLSGSTMTDLPTQLAMLELSTQAQQAFVQSILDYNQWIADYALSLAPPSQRPVETANMLVAPRQLIAGSAPSALAQTPRGAGLSGATQRGGSSPPTVSVIEPASPAWPRQPIERVSGVEPTGGSGANSPPVVAPAFGAAPPNSGTRNSINSPPPAAAPAASLAPLSPAVPSPTPSAGASGGSNPVGIGGSPAPSGSFAPSGAFAPPPSIPSFEPPQPQPLDGRAPAPPPPGNGATGFKLGG